MENLLKNLYKNEVEKPQVCRAYLLKLINESSGGISYDKIMESALSFAKKKEFFFSLGSKGGDCHNSLGSYSLKEVLEDFEEKKLIVKGIAGNNEIYLITEEGRDELNKKQDLIKKFFGD